MQCCQRTSICQFIWRICVEEVIRPEDLKEAKLVLLSDKQRIEIREFYKNLDPRKTPGLNHRLEVVADFFSRKFNLSIRAGTVAKIVNFSTDMIDADEIEFNKTIGLSNPRGSNAMKNVGKVDHEEASLKTINDEQRTEIQEFYKMLDPKGFPGLNHRLEMVADFFSKKLNRSITAGTVAKILHFGTESKV